ncbi:HAD family hydrolase [Nonomuraea roseola]|uniref:HAD family hydrolase n=1 Tax=Nonomuraea roseola TaxID=46179 RepID=UPI0031F94966
MSSSAPVLLTGDNPCARLADQVGILAVRAGLLPQDKVAAVREVEQAGRRVPVVGDGVNDAPALAAAHTGIAMGRAGSDLALETADTVILRDELATIAAALGVHLPPVRPELLGIHLAEAPAPVIEQHLDRRAVDQSEAGRVVGDHFPQHRLGTLRLLGHMPGASNTAASSSRFPLARSPRPLASTRSSWSSPRSRRKARARLRRRGWHPECNHVTPTAM